jgi:hypothetical protein
MGYLSYTSLGPAGLLTRIASTADAETFSYATDANAFSDLTVSTTDTSVCGSASCSGELVHETSSLVDDTTDPDPTRRFKLFDYSYVIVPAASPAAQHAWGYIGLYTAASPTGPWSGGVKALGWTSTAAAVSSGGAATVLTTVADLADCAAFTEPAALVDEKTGDLALALGCVSTPTLQPRVVLLLSTDHAASFKYVGVLLSPKDGTSLGSTTPGVMPSDFFQDEGTTYLIVSTLGTTPTVTHAPEGYTSCTTVAINDLSSGSLKRDVSGNPIVVRQIVGPAGTFTGACSFKPELLTGYLVPEVIATATRPNQIFTSGLRCP